MVPGIRALLAELHAEVDRLEAEVVPSWEGLVEVGAAWAGEMPGGVRPLGAGRQAVWSWH